MLCRVSYIFLYFSKVCVKYAIFASRSDHPSLQQAAFQVLVHFIVHHLTWHQLNHRHSIEGYHKLRNSFQDVILLDSALSLSQWKSEDVVYDENWLLYYEATTFLWTTENIDSWVSIQLRQLQTADVTWISGYTAHERLLIYLIASWS